MLAKAAKILVLGANYLRCIGYPVAIIDPFRCVRETRVKFRLCLSVKAVGMHMRCWATWWIKAIAGHSGAPAASLQTSRGKPD